MLAAALTLLPAVLSLLGRRAFWPGRGSEPGERSGRWARVAGLVRRRPRTIVAAVSAALLVLALGNLVHHGTIGFGEGETRSTESSRGNEVLDEHFPPGIGSPLTAVVGDRRSRGGDERAGDARLGQARGAGAAVIGLDEAAVAIVLRGNPYSGEAADRSRGSASSCRRSRRAPSSAASRPRTTTSSRPTRATPG